MSPHHRHTPLLLVSEHRGRTMVMACNRPASRHAVRPGMTLAQAAALLPGEVRTAPYRPGQDARALHALARWAVRFTPDAADDPPDGLTLDATGCQRLYGSEQAMAEQVVEALAALGFTARAAVAPTIGAAWAVARCINHKPAAAERPRGSAPPPRTAILTDDTLPAALDPLPVATLRLEPGVVEHLAEVGITRVEHLRRLPRHELAGRFDGQVLRRLDQSLGQAPETIVPVRVQPPPMVEAAFAGPSTNVEAIEAMARQLLDRLGAELLRQEAGVRRLVLEVDRLDRDLRTETHRESLTLSRPSRTASHLWALLRPRLERLHLGHGIERLALRAAGVARLRHGQLMWRPSDAGPPATTSAPPLRLVGHPLAPGSAGGRSRTSADTGLRPAEPGANGSTVVAEQDADDADAEVSRLIDLLQARLGADRVVCAEPVDTHVPEAAARYRPANEPPPACEPTGTPPAHRPTVLLDRPRPIRVTLLQPEGPVLMVANGGTHRIVRTIGPERIGRRWWRLRPGKGDHAARDYYRLQDQAGRWLWVYRLRGWHRRTWWLHGAWE